MYILEHSGVDSSFFLLGISNKSINTLVIYR